MSPKQHDLVVKLVGEKVLPEGDPKTVYVLSYVAGTAATPSGTQTRSMIDWLLALPRREQAAPAEVDVPAGRYAVVHPERSIVEFYRVDRPTEGRWAGYTFVKQQASDDLYPVKGARAKDILARIAEDPRAAMIRYGHELGRCGNCGRTLTDEVSRAMGIGPDCAAKLGIARISEEEAVAVSSTAAAQAEAPEPSAPAMPSVDLLEAADEAARETVAVDKQGVPLAVGGWRARKRYAEQQQREERQAKSEATMIHVLPGETWEDIFS